MTFVPYQIKNSSKLRVEFYQILQEMNIERAILDQFHFIKYTTQLAIIVGLFINGSVSAQTIITGVDGRTVDANRLDWQIKSLMDSLAIPGLSMAIINEAEIVYHQIFGVQNIQTKDQIDKQSIFEGASLSKPIFAYFAI